MLAPPLLGALLALRQALARGDLPLQLREIEAFSNIGSGENKESGGLLLTATFAGFPARIADASEKIKKIIPNAESILFHDPGRDRMELFGPGFLSTTVAGTAYRVGHFSFFQVNRFLNEALVEEVAGGEESGRLAVDLFAGVGLFSLPLTSHFERVVAVESIPAASRDMEFNARGRTSIEIRTADSERFLERFKEKPDLVVLDPPRAGLAPEALRHLVRIAPARITYVSCEPPTLSRDLPSLIAAGYEIAKVSLFDLFPQTFHMETVVRLRRRA